MLKITFVTDFVCPFCIVAKEAMKKALSDMSLAAEFNAVPFELTPEGELQVDTYNNPEKREHYKILAGPVAELGIDAKIPPHIIPRPYTRLAWEAWFYAKDNGKGDEWCDAMYRAYFIDEKDIGDIDVLADTASRLGLDVCGLKDALAAGEYSESLKKADAYSKETLGVTSIPAVWINDRKVTIERYSIDEMKEIFSLFADKQLF